MALLFTKLFSFAIVPYYLIIIWTKNRKKPFRGIRLIDNVNINTVYQMHVHKAQIKFNNDLVEVEVQMLPKMCRAVQEHLKEIQSKS